MLETIESYTILSSVESAIEDVRNGKIVIVVDDDLVADGLLGARGLQDAALFLSLGIRHAVSALLGPGEGAPMCGCAGCPQR